MRGILEDKINTVQSIQDYITGRIGDDRFSAADVYRAFGYSRRNIDRLFKAFTGKTPAEYIRALRLTRSTKALLEESNILDIALDSGYESHEGYTRAFSDIFGVTPKDYRVRHSPIPLFIAYPVRDYYAYLTQKEKLKMNKNTVVCTVTCVSRPKRKLMFLRSKKGRDYWSFCEEMGCEWEGLLNSIPEKFDLAAFLELPESLIKEGGSFAAAGIEVPFDYVPSKVPEGYDMAELEPCELLYFQTEPFEKEEEFGAAIDAAFKAVEKYRPENYGYSYDFKAAPKFNFGASAAMGAKMALPVRKK